MKDAHGEKPAAVTTGPAAVTTGPAAVTPPPGPATSGKLPGPLSVTGSVKSSTLTLGPPPPLVPIRSVSPLKLALTSPAAMTDGSQLSTPPALKQESISRLPTAAQVLSGIKGSPVGPGGLKVAVGHSPLIGGEILIVKHGLDQV